MTKPLAPFKEAIDECLEKVKTMFTGPVKTLLNPEFQLFKNRHPCSREAYTIGRYVGAFYQFHRKSLPERKGKTL